MSEISDEEVDYGSPDIDAIPYTDSDHAWSTHGALPGYTKKLPRRWMKNRLNGDITFFMYVCENNRNNPKCNNLIGYICT